MRKVEREEIVDYHTYEDQREAFRLEAIAAKALRRVHVGHNLTFLFECPLTIRYQVQEMTRAERIVRDRDIQRELDTYNGLLGENGGLGATLLIEIEDPKERDVRLREWLALPRHLYARLADGSVVRATYDAAQIGDDRLSSVQYLKFPVRGQAPVAIGSDLPGFELESKLSDAQRQTLAEDLK